MAREMMSSLASPGDKAYDGAIIVCVSFRQGQRMCVSLMVSDHFLETVLDCDLSPRGQFTTHVMILPFKRVCVFNSLLFVFVI